jgi:hypothetical protein
MDARRSAPSSYFNFLDPIGIDSARRQVRQPATVRSATRITRASPCQRRDEAPQKEGTMHMSATARGMLILCLSLALWATACAMDAEPDPALDEIAEAEIAGEADTSEATSDAEVDAMEPTAAATCYPPGRPLPPRFDDDWIRCQVECRAHGGTHHGCRRTCCEEYTGCVYCFQQ